jgi:hypothetical protein
VLRTPGVLVSRPAPIGGNKSSLSERQHFFLLDLVATSNVSVLLDEIGSFDPVSHATISISLVIDLKVAQQRYLDANA